MTFLEYVKWYFLLSIVENTSTFSLSKFTGDQNTCGNDIGFNSPQENSKAFMDF